MQTTQQELYFGSMNFDRNRNRRMVFYGRVSTQHEQQKDALSNQMQWYDDQLKYHTNWQLVGRYIDEGITGTLAKKRPAFMQMLGDARNGKFDLIVTREVCRFARNTVDTLSITRELRSIGVEVYFVSDNIWTLDSDGELRLSIMSSLAQEESRKISERVLAGQMISRQNGVLYGNGNILGYDLDKVHNTYIVNEEQAKVVRFVFEMYAKGLGQSLICNELTRLGYKDSQGNVKWSCIKISKILRNATYMGYIGYNKSKTTNYIDKVRVKNLDEDSIQLVKGNFPPLVSEELWYECNRIRKQKIATYRCPDGSTRRAGYLGPMHLWTQKLRCRCGGGFNRSKWRTLKDGTPVYGYQCNYRTANVARSFVQRHHLHGQKSCDAISLCEWRLELMAKLIFDRIWGNQDAAVKKAVNMIAGVSNRTNSSVPHADNSAQISKLKSRKLRLAQMYADGDLSRDEYKELSAKAEQEISALQNVSVNDTAQQKAAATPSMKELTAALNRIIDLSAPKLPDSLIQEFVEVVTPIKNDLFRWKLNFGPQVPHAERTDLTKIGQEPLLKFKIDFETAQQYRRRNNMPSQFRRSAWTDLRVEVYI